MGYIQGHLYTCAKEKDSTYMFEMKESTMSPFTGMNLFLFLNSLNTGAVQLSWFNLITCFIVYLRNVNRHGVKQLRNPWSDGPNYVTQCPIKPGASFTYEIVLSNEEGTLWWHAHSDWSRATVHGPLIVLPQLGKTYPFPKPCKEVPIVLGEH